MTPMKFGILGAARIAAGALIPALEKAGNATALAVAARDEVRAREFALEHRVPVVHPSYEALLEDSEVEAVYIPLPNSEHLPWTLRALEAGKHVLCEKPLAMNAGEVQTMWEAAGKSGKLLLEAFMWRFHPQLDLAMSRLPELGELRHIGATFSFSLERPQDIRWVRELGGGALYDVGCYALSAARTFAGREPVEVIARTLYTDPESFGGGVDHRTVALLEFGGGLRASIDCAFSLPMRQRVELVGEKGTLTLESPFVPGRSSRERLLHGAQGPQVLLNGEALEVPGADQYQLMLEHFVRAARGEEPLRYGPEDSLKQARALDALLESGLSGQAVWVG